MIDPKATLLRLNQNLSILREREAKYAGNSPLELLNQIVDHKQAIELTRQVITGELDETEWRASLNSLVLACHDGQVVNIENQMYIAGNSISIQQFISKQTPLAEQLEFFSKQIGLQSMRSSNYANSQFEAYCRAWKSLQSLRLAADSMWEKASTENLMNFSKQKRRTLLVVREGEVFFDEQDRQSLLRVLDSFGEFHLGKKQLIDFRSKQELDHYIQDEIGSLEEAEILITERIQDNRRLKMEYESLLEKIRISFKKRLSSYR